MARTVLPIAGAIIGAFYGNPYAGYAIGAAIAGVVDPINTKGPRIGETGAQTSQEGAPRAIVYGTCQVTGNVIASGPLIKRDVKESQGKGGGTTSTEHAYRTYAVRICEGPVASFLRVWQDDKLVYDIRPSSTMTAESAKWLQNVVFYAGGEDQLPDPSLQMIFGVDEVPAHRGSAYMLKIEDDLTDRRGSIPQFRFEVAASSIEYDVVAPLMIFPWDTLPAEGALRPIHGGDTGITGYTTGFDSYASTDFMDALDHLLTVVLPGVLEVYVKTTGIYSGTFIGYTQSGNATFSGFPGGADLSGDPRFVDYRLSPVGASSIAFGGPDLGNLNAELADAGAAVDDGKAYYLWQSEHQSYVPYPGDLKNIYNVVSTLPTTGQFSATPGGTYLGGKIGMNAVPVMRAERVPSPPENFVRVAGTAKQLCGITYVSDQLYQNALGPVLLPDHPDYNNADFWAAARAAAILDGTLEADISTPVVVSAYAAGLAAAVGEPVPLSFIVEDIHARCNFPAEKFDVSELTDLVSGLVLAGDYTGADAINTLRSLYLFDAADQDKLIVYPRRGKAVVATITEDDIVEAEESSRREQAIEYPKKLHLSYQNAVGGYAVAKATSARSSPDVRVVGEVSTSVPVVLSPDQAAQTAAIMHKIAWAEAEGETKLSVPLSWIKFIASDCFGVALRGRVTRERLDDLNTADGVIEYTMRRDRQSAYTSQVTGIPIPEPTPPPSTIVGETVLAVLDISPRTESEDDLNLLYAVTGGLPAWAGATVQRSLDAGANYSSVVDINRGQILGTLVNGLADASEFYTDTTNVLRVQLYRDTQTIESITDAQFLSEGGSFAVRRPDGSWEVMQYRDADEVSAGVFDLSYLHRGQLNSDTSSHLAGALFVMLEDAVHASAQSAWIGAGLTHRAVSYGESPETADEQSQTYVGRSQIEWPVAYLTLARDGADNVSATWTPRHRFGTEDQPVESVNFRGYRVTLDDGVLPAVSFDTTLQSFTYDASALGTPLTVSVSSLNRITGAGPSTSGSV